jgi:membrane protease YdiL (CAAX protease family)
MLIFVLLPQIVSLFLTLATAIAFPNFYQSPWYIWFNQVLCIYMLAMPLALLVMGLPARAERRMQEHMSFGQLFRYFGLMQAVAIVGSLISQAFMAIVSALAGGEHTLPLDEVVAGTPWWILFLVVGLIGPIVEELVCRGAVMSLLLPYGEKSAILFSSLLFGLMHGNFYQLFYAVGLGLILGYVYARTRRLLYPCLLHVAFNSLSCLQSVFYDALGSGSLATGGTAEEQMAWLSGKLLPLLGIGLCTLLMYSLALCGFILTLIHYRSLHFKKCPLPLTREERASAWFGNLGMILYIVISMFMFGLTLFLL